MKLKIILLITIVINLTSFAHANLLVTPTRVELDNKRDKSAVFSLVNKSNQTSRYEIYLEDKQLLPSGEFEIIDSETSTTSLASFTRYSPRRVSLTPEQGTRVRLAVRPPKDIKQGEYRSYIVFHQIPLAPTSSEQTTDKTDSLSLSVTAYLRIAIPVIMRVGELTAQLNIANHQISDTEGQQQLIVSIARQGERSSYGDIEVFDAKSDELIGSSKNAAIYTEMTHRAFAVTLNNKIKPGTDLVIKYVENDGLFKPQTIEQKITF
ncbi:hypothetical protein Q4601_01700 [Shewanella sp. 1_MG-2023]|uniref:hypothetical protein n=1 Tax=unclassified Shewanella TaxID=196818 RepID=UPI0026E24807|nr:MULTISPECIES: hypothetical protein [unclassified Shewanella]MDO6609922.1 hypothetical protein [Shewanella sp. 7_MG-2023]MDO6769936.1 hypothetical protein [Shewanella sp. 2_MG-2023]MDO6793000.1 hypothetical protein [Shewanella sp. 1_MG-2023]